MDQFVYQVNELQHLHEHKLMMITGDPGSGKTTLMRYLAKEWAEGKVLQSCRILLLIYLGSFKVEYKSLSYVLKHTVYDDYGSTKEIAKMIYSNHGEGTCFLLDAYDEKSLKQDFLENLINFNHLPRSLRIVTSRPSFADEVSHKLHIKLVGFSKEYVDHYLSQLPELTQTSVHRLWHKHSEMLQACQSPLYLSLIVCIVATDPDHALSLSTRTQLYLSVMESLIVHYQDKFNAGSLRDCIIKKTCCSDNIMCCAFHTLQRVGFEIIFKGRERFEIESFSLHASIKSLSIVSVHPVTNGEVTYSFAHRTFAEFFAALHLTTLSLEERLFYIAKHLYWHVVWQFYFGLMGKYHPKNVTTISTSLKRYFSHPVYHKPFSRVCEIYCNTDNLVVLTRSKIETIHELGSMVDYFYVSTGIVVNSSVVISQYGSPDFIYLLAHILEVANVHKLCYHLAYHSVIAVEDWNQKLNIVHLDFIHHIVNSEASATPFRMSLPKTSSVTTLYLSPESPLLVNVRKNLKFFHHLSRFCMDTTADWHSNNIQNELYEVLYHSSKATYIELSTLVDESSSDLLNSYSSIHVLRIGLSHPRKVNMASFQLLKVLRKPSELHLLQLYSVPCEDMSMFLSGLTGLKQLEIIRSNLVGCTDVLLRHLAQFARLITLRLVDTKLEFQKLTHILPAMFHLGELHLRKIGLTDDDISRLSFALKNVTSLISLHLTSEFMTDTSVRALVSALNSESHYNFRELSLSYDYVGRNVDDFLTLAQLSHLHLLDVAAVKQFENLDKLVKVFKFFTQLKHLHLRTNSLTSEVQDTLIRSVSHLTDLQLLVVGEFV